MSYLTDETIVALATPQGVGAIGVIRLSGKDAVTICNKIFIGKNLEQQPTHTIHFGKIAGPEKIIDEVLVSIFIAPHSYTGENGVEISTHGSPFIQEQIIRLLILHGGRLAKPGEFTLRAFLNGKMDLSEAEAVADLIAATSASSHAVAMQQMRGGFSNEIKKLREQLIHFASLIELELDFSEEDVEFADRTQLMNLIKNIGGVLSILIESFKLGNVIKNGVNTVIAGRPNAGKSTLLNVMLNEERAIVSPIPGTTRDTIEEALNIEGIIFRLTDTAGIREATDAIERIGIEKTMEKIQQSTIVVYIFDANEISREELKNDIDRMKIGTTVLFPVGNKIDQGNLKQLQEKFEGIDRLIFVSAKEKINIDLLKKRLSEIIFDKKINSQGIIVSNVRHYEALTKALDAINEVMNGLNQRITGELLSQDIKSALQNIGEITGEVTSDDLLENIFSKFCIGK